MECCLRGFGCEVNVQPESDLDEILRNYCHSISDTKCNYQNSENVLPKHNRHNFSLGQYQNHEENYDVQHHTDNVDTWIETPHVSNTNILESFSTWPSENNVPYFESRLNWNIPQKCHPLSFVTDFNQVASQDTICVIPDQETIQPITYGTQIPVSCYMTSHPYIIDASCTDNNKPATQDIGIENAYTCCLARMHNDVPTNRFPNAQITEQLLSFPSTTSKTETSEGLIYSQHDSELLHFPSMKDMNISEVISNNYNKLGISEVLQETLLHLPSTAKLNDLLSKVNADDMTNTLEWVVLYIFQPEYDFIHINSYTISDSLCIICSSSAQS